MQKEVAVMIDTLYGTVFHRLRTNKNITLQTIENATGISNSFVSRFERGKSDITLTKLMPLLKAIHVPYPEFFFEYTYSRLADPADSPAAIRAKLAAFLTPLDDNLTTGFTLRSEHYEEAVALATKQKARFQAEPSQTNLLMLAFFRGLAHYLQTEYTTVHPVAAGVIPPDTGTPILRHYLLTVDDWGSYEITLFVMAAVLFTPAENLQLLRQGYRKSQRLGISRTFTTLQFQLLFSDFTVLLARRAWPEAQAVLTMMTERPSNDLTERNLTLFARGWLQIRQGQRTAGEKTCRQALAIFRILGADESATLWETYLTGILSEPPSEFILLNLDF